MRDEMIRLQIVGTGSYEEELKQMAKELEVKHQVEFFGYCPRENLKNLYNASDCFILPSMTESFGIVFAEAMACGLLVIGGRVGGVSDLVREENGILIEPGNIAQIISSIKILKNDRSLFDQMSKANRIRVEKHYHWRGISEKYLDIYRAAAN